jgi:hypothetical protein
MNETIVLNFPPVNSIHQETTVDAETRIKIPIDYAGKTVKIPIYYAAPENWENNYRYPKKHCGTVIDESVASGWTKSDFTPATKSYLPPKYKQIEFTPHGKRFGDIVRQELVKAGWFSKITQKMKACRYLAKNPPKRGFLAKPSQKRVKLELIDGSVCMNKFYPITGFPDMTLLYRRNNSEVESVEA